MNTLIKIIITTVIGFFGPMEVGEDSRVNLEADNNLSSEIMKPEPHPIKFCRFEDISCKKLNYNISS